MLQQHAPMRVEVSMSATISPL
ncbi:unnamed protein product, partial [Allacma fusca]